MSHRHQSHESDKSSLYHRVVASFGRHGGLEERNALANLRALVRLTELGPTNAHYAFLQRPAAKHCVDVARFASPSGESVTMPGAHPVIIMEPKGPIGFRFDIADVREEYATGIHASGLVAPRLVTKNRILKRLWVLSEIVQLRFIDPKPPTSSKEPVKQEWRDWGQSFCSSACKSDVAAAVFELARGFSEGVEIPVLVDPRQSKARLAGRDPVFDAHAIAAVVMARLEPSGSSTSFIERLSDEECSDLDCYFIAIAANRIVSQLVHSSRSLAEQDRDAD